MLYRTGAICWQDEYKDITLLKGKYFKYHFNENKNDSVKNENLELLIEAKNEQKAQQAYELFISALTLLNGHSLHSFDQFPSVYTLDELNNLECRRDKYMIQYSQSGIKEASIIAAKASFRKKLYISLYKYLIACNHHSNYIIHLDPFNTEYFKLPKNPLDHLRYGYAIMVFYSIIEELGLEIRASNKNPSKIKGQWNLSVKNDLEERLVTSGIDLTEKQNWNLRSKPTKIHSKDKLKLYGKASWARYNVRDSKIEIIDAISYTSWLRSKVIAHKVSDELMSISIYDVANVNFLLRRILLDSLEKK